MGVYILTQNKQALWNFDDISRLHITASGRAIQAVGKNGSGENDNRCSVWECEYINRDKAIEAYMEREWIPTSLCLPKECRPVLVAVKTKDRLPKWIEEQTYHYVTDIDVYDENGWMDNGKNVVAWQPLPAPYKGE